MQNLPTWATRAIGLWIFLGSTLATLGIAGLPEWVPVLFSETFTDSLVLIIGQVITFYQVLRGIFLVAPKDENAEIKILSIVDKQKYQFNPFKLAA